MSSAVAPNIRIERVESKRDLKAFIDVPRELYRDDPAWVAPLRFERMGVLDKSKNPYFDHARAEYWIAYKDNDPVGRISAQVDDLAQDWHGEGTGHFGFIESPDDPAVFKALFNAAENWLHDQGMTRVMGPFNLSVNEECGLLVDGFEHPPRLLMGHALPYYEARVEEQGYSACKTMYAYDLDIRREWPERTRRILAKAAKNERMMIRPLNMKNLDSELKLFISIFNDAWSDNWGFVPFTDAEIAKLGDDLKLFLRPDICHIAYWDGEPAAFMIVLPDINNAIAGMNGRLFPFGWAKLVWNLILHIPSQGRVPLMGVRKQYQSKVAGALMSLSLIDACRKVGHEKYGITRGELSWILEDNTGMRTMLDSIGCKQYKTYRVFEKTKDRKFIA